MTNELNDPGSAERARWLAELAEAIEDAKRVAWRLGFGEGNDSEARELYAQLEAARAEVEALRRGPGQQPWFRRSTLGVARTG